MVTLNPSSYGENIYRGTLGFDFMDDTDPLTFARDSVKDWYNQEPHYTYTFGTSTGPSGGNIAQLAHLCTCVVG